MASSTPKVAKATPEAPNPQANEQNTTQTTLPENPDPVVRADENVRMVVARTGQAVENVSTLVAETLDHLETEARANRYANDRNLDTLSLEQRDHAQTLAYALGINGQQSNDELMKNAKKRAEELKNYKRDESKDNKANSVPANWRITPKDDGTIEAINTVTQKTFSGKPEDLFKAS